MFGLAVMGGLFLYFLISVGVVVLAVKWAKREGGNPYVFGFLAAFIMYNLVFWQAIPNYVLFKYYCATKSGFWVYKTPEQWKQENPGVAETLTWRDNSPDYKVPGIDRGYQLNERIGWVFIEHQNSFLPVVIQDELIIDIKNNETLVQRTRIYSGDSRDLRVWLYLRQPPFKLKEFRSMRRAYERLGDKIQ